MKKALLICALATVILVIFAGSALAFHMPDPQGKTCFRCHNTHQGVGELLLAPLVQPSSSSPAKTDLKDVYGVVSPSTVCLACHDGTGNRAVTSMVNSTGGTHRYAMTSGSFDLSSWPGGANVSAHTVDINVSYLSPIAEAPGNKNLSFYENPMGEDLSCASCHNPHANIGSFKYLKLNPNNSIDGKFYFGSDWAVELAAKPEVATITLTSKGGGVYGADAGQFPWLRAYIYTRGNPATQNYIKYPVAVQIDGVWKFQRDPSNLGTVNFTVNSITGEIKFASGDPNVGTLTAKVFMPLTISSPETYIGNYLDKTGAAQTLDVRVFAAGNYGNTVNRWCASCHGNYDIRSRSNDTYTEGGDEFHGHNVYRSWNTDFATPYTKNAFNSAGKIGTSPTTGLVAREANCLSCHYSHGTNADIMWDSNKQIIGDRGFVDSNPANKRYFGGSVCIKCHYNSAGEFFMWDNTNRPEPLQWQ